MLVARTPAVEAGKAIPAPHDVQPGSDPRELELLSLLRCRPGSRAQTGNEGLEDPVVVPKLKSTVADPAYAPRPWAADFCLLVVHQG